MNQSFTSFTTNIWTTKKKRILFSGVIMFKIYIYNCSLMAHFITNDYKREFLVLTTEPFNEQHHTAQIFPNFLTQF